jgi:hypothetical protein
MSNVRGQMSEIGEQNSAAVLSQLPTVVCPLCSVSSRTLLAWERSFDFVG